MDEDESVCTEQTHSLSPHQRGSRTGTYRTFYS